MTSTTRQRLLELSARFYRHHGASFDASRGQAWPGWSRLCQSSVSTSNPWRCFDAGCGNGRFARFLHQQLVSEAGPRPALDFVGVDLDESLLAAARRDLAPWTGPDHFEFVGFDLTGSATFPVPAGSQDLVSLFGVLHHVPGEAQRRLLLRQLGDLVAVGGRLVASIWRLDRDADRFARKQVPWAAWNQRQPADRRIDLADLDEGDVLLSWRGDPEVPRYCHFPTGAELERLEDLAPRLDLVERFEADGPTGRDNLYLVWCATSAC